MFNETYVSYCNNKGINDDNDGSSGIGNNSLSDVNNVAVTSVVSNLVASSLDSSNDNVGINTRLEKKTILNRWSSYPLHETYFETSPNDSKDSCDGLDQRLHSCTLEDVDLVSIADIVQDVVIVEVDVGDRSFSINIELVQTLMIAH